MEISLPMSRSGLLMAQDEYCKLPQLRCVGQNLGRNIISAPYNYFLPHKNWNSRVPPFFHSVSLFFKSLGLGIRIRVFSHFPFICSLFNTSQPGIPPHSTYPSQPIVHTEVWTKSLYQPRVAKHRNTNTTRVPLSSPEFIWELRYLRRNSIFMNNIFYCVL